MMRSVTIQFFKLLAVCLFFSEPNSEKIRLQRVQLFPLDEGWEILFGSVFAIVI